MSGLVGREATFRAFGPDAIGQRPRVARLDGWAFVPLDTEDLDALVKPGLRDTSVGFG